jgi:predicted N-acetyltransferase YhbS
LNQKELDEAFMVIELKEGKLNDVIGVVQYSSSFID